METMTDVYLKGGKERMKKLKILFMLGITILLICLFNTKVNAISINIDKGNITEEIFKEVVPNTVELDMKSGNLKTFENQIIDQVISNLKEKGISVSKSKENTNTFLETVWEENDTNNADLSIYYRFSDNTGNYDYYHKKISVKWINKIEYNETDKQKFEELLKKLGFIKNNQRRVYLYL